MSEPVTWTLPSSVSKHKIAVCITHSSPANTQQLYGTTKPNPLHLPNIVPCAQQHTPSPTRTKKPDEYHQCERHGWYTWEMECEKGLFSSCFSLCNVPISKPDHPLERTGWNTKILFTELKHLWEAKHGHTPVLAKAHEKALLVLVVLVFVDGSHNGRESFQHRVFPVTALYKLLLW